MVESMLIGQLTRRLDSVQVFLALAIISIEIVLLTDSITWQAGNHWKAFHLIRWSVLATVIFAVLSIGYLVQLLVRAQAWKGQACSASCACELR